MKIGEIANKTNLPASTLRYYEKKGRRYYKESDIEWIKFIRRLKETGMLIKDIQHYSELRYVGSITMPERLQILQLHRNYVLEQQLKWTEYLQNLDDKIEFYQQSIKNMTKHNL